MTLPKLEKGAEPTSEELQRLRTEYEKGATVEELAAAIHRCTRTVYNYLQKAGAEMRPRGGTNGVTLAKSTRARLAARLKREHDKGTSIRVLAGRLGRSFGYIQKLLKEAEQNAQTDR